MHHHNVHRVELLVGFQRPVGEMLAGCRNVPIEQNTFRQIGYVRGFLGKSQRFPYINVGYSFVGGNVFGDFMLQLNVDAPFVSIPRIDLLDQIPVGIQHL